MTTNLQAIIQAGYCFYIGTRLYDFWRKLETEYLDQELRDLIRTMAHPCETSGALTFVPFRDSNQATLCGSDAAAEIFRRDMAKLGSGKIIAFAGIFNDVSKDDGMAFEMGYCYAKGIPIFLLDTDFITIEETDSTFSFCFDPLIEYICNGFLHEWVLPTSGDQFGQRLLQAEAEARRKFLEMLARFLGSEFCRPTPLTRAAPERIMIDFGGGRCEYQREYAMKTSLMLAGAGYKTVISARLASGQDKPPYERASEDMENLRHSALLIISAL